MKDNSNNETHHNNRQYLFNSYCMLAIVLILSHVSIHLIFITYFGGIIPILKIAHDPYPEWRRTTKRTLYITITFILGIKYNFHLLMKCIAFVSIRRGRKRTRGLI